MTIGFKLPVHGVIRPCEKVVPKMKQQRMDDLPPWLKVGRRCLESSRLCIPIGGIGLMNTLQFHLGKWEFISGHFLYLLHQGFWSAMTLHASKSSQRMQTKCEQHQL